MSILSSIWCCGLLGLFQILGLCATWVFLGTIGPALAQPQQALGNWQLSVGWQDYSEPQMNLKGPELGVHWTSISWGAYTLDAHAQIGLQNYNSPYSGRLEHVPNLDTRWRALTGSTTQPQWQFGLALHTHSNFMRGTTSLGFGGYDRLSTQLWLPVRWQSVGDQWWAVDAGWLLWGEHVSRLKQVNAGLQDLTSKQSRGVYLQVSKKVNSSRGALEPYARWTWVDDSDLQKITVAGQATGAYEPENNRLQAGVKWQFR